MKLVDPHPHRRFLPRVQKPARYAGCEYAVAPHVEDAEIRVALAFPDLYEVGCSNLGMEILYRLARRSEGVGVDRVFAPWPDYARELVDRRLPLCSRQGAIPLCDFDVLGFSLQHEMTFTTVLWMLDLGRIALHSVDRTDSDPLVIAGGPATTNPEPLADFIDVFAPGDGESSLPDIIDNVRSSRRARESRSQLLERMAGRPGLYVPSLYEREDTSHGRRVVVGRRVEAASEPPILMADAHRLCGAEVPIPTIPSIESVFDRFQVELARGCTGGCRFCHAGSVYRPPRERSPGEVVRAVIEGVLTTGYDEVSLASLSTADYPALAQLVEALGPILDERRVALSVASLRAYGLSDEVLEAIRRVRTTGMTLAPEAGTDRLRGVINKDVTRSDLLGALARMQSLGWQKAKLYFMMGLPTETDDDLRGMADLIIEAARVFRSRGHRRRLTVSVSNFVAKPFTPFEREPVLVTEQLVDRARRLRGMLKNSGATVTFHDPHQSVVEALLARGGQEMCAAVEAAYRAGSILDGWSEHHDPDAWQAGLRAAGVDPRAGCAGIDDAHPLPWDVFEPHVDRQFIDEQMVLARDAERTERCDGPVGEKCHDCGAPCDPADSALHDGDDTASGLASARKLLDGFDARVDEIWAPADPERVRHFLALRFDRMDSAAWLGHRDMVRAISMWLRRAGVPLRYSKGFTPRPRLAFTSAMPVGVVGLSERLRVEVTRPLHSAEKLLKELERTAPPGIACRAAAIVDTATGKKLVSGADAIRVFLGIDPCTDLETIENALESIRAESSIVVERIAHSRTIEVDLVPLLGNLSTARLSDIPELTDPDLDPSTRVVVALTSSIDGRWIRPLEISELLQSRSIRVEWIARIVEISVGP